MPTQNNVELQITIKDVGGKQLDNIIKMMERLDDLSKNIARSFSSIEKSTTDLNRALGKTTSSTQQFENRLNRLQNEFDQVRRASDRAETSMLDYSESLSRVSAGLARVRDFGARQLTNFVRAAGRLEDVTQAYTSVLGSAQAAANAVDQLRTASQDPGLTFEVAARATQRFLAFGVSLEDSIQITRNFANAAVVSGTSLAELDTGLQQLAKSIGVGKIEQEDLNSITERFGPIAQNIRREYGKTGEEVTKAFQGAGQSVAQFALSVSDLDKQPKAASDSLSNAISNLQNAWFELSSDLGDRILPLVKDIINQLTGLINRFNALPDSTKNAVIAFGAVSTALAAIGTAATAAAAGMAALNIALAGGGAARSAGLIANITATLPLAGRLLRVLGRLGIVLAAIGVGTAGYQAGVESAQRDVYRRLGRPLEEPEEAPDRRRGGGIYGNREGINRIWRWIWQTDRINELPIIQQQQHFQQAVQDSTRALFDFGMESERAQSRNEEDAKAARERGEAYVEFRKILQRATGDVKNFNIEASRAGQFEGEPPFTLPGGLQPSMRIRQPRPPRFTGSPFFRTPLGTHRQPPDFLLQGYSPIPSFDTQRIFALQPLLQNTAREIGKAFADAADLAERAWVQTHAKVGTLDSRTTQLFLANSKRVLDERQKNLNAARNLIELINRRSLEVSVENVRALKDLNIVRLFTARRGEEATNALTAAQDRYTNSVQRSVVQFNFLKSSIQSLFDAVNQGTRSGAQGVTGFGTGFIQFTNTLIQLGELVTRGTGSGLFHDPVNDRIAQAAGFRAGYIGTIRAAQRQSARDFSNSYGMGVQRAERANTHYRSSGGDTTIVNQMVIDGRVVKEWSNLVNKMQQSGRVHLRTA